MIRTSTEDCQAVDQDGQIDREIDGYIRSTGIPTTTTTNIIIIIIVVVVQGITRVYDIAVE